METGQLLFYGNQALQLAAHLKEDDEAGRAQLFARLPALREFFEAACGLRAKGWKAQAIATRLRQHRMERIEAQPRVSWETRYQRALDAVFAMVQARAFELAGQEGTVKELAVRLLSDALEAAENLES